MEGFRYEWWTVVIKQSVGTSTFEVKAKNRDNAIKQIQSYQIESYSAKNMSKPVWERTPTVQEIYWDTLKLDRVGYQRIS